MKSALISRSQFCSISLSLFAYVFFFLTPGLAGMPFLAESVAWGSCGFTLQGPVTHGAATEMIPVEIPLGRFLSPDTIIPDLYIQRPSTRTVMSEITR